MTHPDTQSVDSEFVELVQSLRDDLDPLTDRIVACFRDEIPEYAVLPEPELRPGVRSNIERAIDALARGGEPSPLEVEGGRVLGELRARQGLPIESVLQAHRIGVREALVLAREHADRSGITAAVVLDLATQAWSWVDAVTLGAARGHREQELDLASHEQQQRAHLLRALLHGHVDDSGLRAAALTHGIERSARYAPICVAGDAHVLRQLERRLAAAGASRSATVLTAILDDGLAAIIDEQHCDAVAVRILEEDNDSLVAVVGTTAPPTELSNSYAFTRRALAAARALDRTGLVEIGEVGIYTAILGEPEIGALLRERYIAPLEAEGDFGAELLATLASWFAHGMRTEETATALPVHPNTLRHRLRRIEEILGLSLSTTTSRFELWWALAVHELVVD